MPKYIIEWQFLGNTEIEASSAALALYAFYQKRDVDLIRDGYEDLKILGEPRLKEEIPASKEGVG